MLSPGAATLTRAAQLGALAIAVSSCAEMRQNVRNEFVSYRGAWFCGEAGCDEAKMQRSARGRREGDLSVSQGKLSNGAALVFNAGKSPDSFSAEVADCSGKSVPVPADKVKPPGAHQVTGQGDSYAVLIDPKDFPDLELGKGCKKWTVSTHASWPKGKWEAKGAVENE
ncbi:MAG: hypothetical protein IAG13_22525 [Deltaproteobacteria bacterium]|nr:hypothetical protein [Nannocystaceae bacterium]